MSRGCHLSLELATLADYWFGDLPPADAERIEEHLFTCDGCGDRLRALAALGDGVRRLAHQGAIQVVVTPSFLQTAARAGLRIREYAVPSGGRVACTVTAQDDLLVGRLGADFTRVSRLDMVSQLEGAPEHRVEDVPVNPEARELIVLQAMPSMRALGRAVLHIRLVSHEGAGERVLGDYTFDHTPTPA